MRIAAYLVARSIAAPCSTDRARYVRNWLAVHLRGWRTAARALAEYVG